MREAFPSLPVWAGMLCFYCRRETEAGKGWNGMELHGWCSKGT